MSLTEPPASPFAEERQLLRHSWLWLLLFGIALVVLGVLCIGASFIATLAVALTFGILLILAGVFALAEAFSARRWSGFFLQLLGGVLYLVVGILVVGHPGAAAAGLTLIIAALFLAGGLFRIVAALSHRFHGWGWVLTNGIITFLLGVLIWAEWPASGLWVIGLFLGIDLLFHGLGWIVLALGLRSLAP